jgi:hypothetical protein
MSDSHEPSSSDRTSVPRASKLEIKDRISLGLSSAALCIAASGFYFQNVRVTNGISVSPIKPAVGGRSIAFDFALANTGSAAMLIETACIVASSAPKSDQQLFCFGSERPTGLPLVLEPGRIIKASVEQDNVDLPTMAQTSLPPEGVLRTMPGWRKLPIGLLLVVFDASGVRRELATAELFHFHYGPDGSTSAPNTDYKASALKW